MKLSPPLATVIAAVLLAGAAQAHPLPKSASPAPNAVLKASPGEIRITFSEGLIAKFSGIEVVNGAGRKADLSPVELAPSNARQLFATIRAPLPAGAYTVNWRAVGDDTHHVSGHYAFQVKP